MEQTPRSETRVYAVVTGQPEVQLLACTKCGVILWDIDAHYTQAHPEPSDSGVQRFLATSAQFPIDPDLIARVERSKSEVLSMGHHFIGVAGHPDDDECTFREDGTDRTYCGRTEGEHYPEPSDSDSSS